MNIQQFQYVLAVAEYRHFETAADKCFIAQSTLSTMISRLEEELGIQIFDRRKKPVDLTKDGREIVGQLKIIISEIDHLEELVKELKGEISGTLKIACIPTVASFLLPNFLPDFSSRYPDIILEVKESPTDEIIRQLKSRELDIGIVSTPIDEVELLEYPLYAEPFVYYSKGQRQTGMISVGEITFDNFWLLEEGHCFRDQVLKICGAAKDQINTSNIHFKAGSIGSLVHFVKASGGKTLLPYSATLSLGEQENRFVSFFKKPVPGRSVGLLTHHHFAKQKILAMMQKVIHEKMSALGYPFTMF